jgi:prolyl-tRNA editing enzyme YbaK/EbsC (Cys-tRNA(Pro) deacylase)/predicted acetyltransferase
MSIERVKEYFRSMNLELRVWEFETSSATVELAAETLGVRPARIAKTLSFAVGDGCVLLVTAGDARVDNGKFKERFEAKAKMLTPDEVARFTGSEIGGVCPFALPENTPVFLDVSLKRFATVFPACGSTNSAMEVTNDELLRYSCARGWVDVCKDWDARDDHKIDTEPNEEMLMPSDSEITLRISSVSPADETKGFVPAYKFEIVRLSDNAVVGEIDLRLGYVRNLYFGGNIGYSVKEEYRGNGFAGKACKLVFQIARAHKMPYLMISCRADNIASRRTLEKLNGTLLETRIPASYSSLYRLGEKDPHCYFRFDLGEDEGDGTQKTIL